MPANKDVAALHLLVQVFLNSWRLVLDCLIIKTWREWWSHAGPAVNSCLFTSCRYDKVGHTMEGQSLTEVKTGSGGGNTNWKTLSDVKTEHLGHGEKVHTCLLLFFFVPSVPPSPFLHFDAHATFTHNTEAHCYSRMILWRCTRTNLKPWQQIDSAHDLTAAAPGAGLWRLGNSVTFSSTAAL